MGEGCLSECLCLLHPAWPAPHSIPGTVTSIKKTSRGSNVAGGTVYCVSWGSRAGKMARTRGVCMYFQAGTVHTGISENPCTSRVITHRADRQTAVSSISMQDRGIHMNYCGRCFPMIREMERAWTSIGTQQPGISTCQVTATLTTRVGRLIREGCAA